MSHYPSDSFRLGAANRDPEEEALGWVVRLTSGDVTHADREEFSIWHEEPENAKVYARARGLWLGLGSILEEQEAAGWPNAAPVEVVSAGPRRHRRKAYWRLSVAASFIFVAFASVQFSRVWQYDQVTGVGIKPEVALADGSVATMGPGTALSTDFSGGRRHVSLARGEAYFDVKHDPTRPFVIASGNGAIRVLGTAFTVRREDQDVTVTVVRGRVQVISGARSEVLTKDRQISFNADGMDRMRAIDSSIATAWMRGRLIMENRPLGEVVAELDRYQGGKVMLLNAEAGERRINAVIDLGRTESWLTALASSQGLKLTKAGPITVLR